MAVKATVCLLVVLCGCNRAPVNRVHLTDHRASAAPRAHFEDFEHGYYRVDTAGLVEIILRKRPDATEPDEIEQLLRIRTYWQARPGLTHARDSMLNARLSYCLFRGSSGISYDGGGFVRYSLDDNTIEGVFEGAQLQPTRQVGQNLLIFENAVVSGRFEVIRDDRMVFRLANQIEQRLGTLPEVPIETRPPAL